MIALWNWLDSRTGIKRLMHEALYEPIPGGARWRYVWGSTLVFAFMTQLITGVFLWMAYSPSRGTAWESVYYIQHEMSGGWFLRGLHHFMAQAMVVLLALHLMQVVIYGAYKAPREVNFWLGLVLMLITLGLALTGYLLPWDQKGYWATVVATNISGVVPVVGDAQQKLAVGGAEYGHHTLTRFFALHAGVLPALLIGFLALHIAVFRKHGIHVNKPQEGEVGMFWPDQILKDGVACLAVLLAVVFCIFWPAIKGDVAWSETGHLGAELGSPADPSTNYSAARPEWYFLFLFQFLKLFGGMGHIGELIGAVIIPGALLLVLALMPILGNWKLGHAFNVLFLFIVLGGAAYLTYAAMREDTLSRGVPADSFAAVRQQIKIREYDKAYRYDDPVKESGYVLELDRYKNWDKSHQYLTAVEAAQREAKRAITLAGGPDKIPPTGALELLRNDPATMGPRLFKQHCVSCHDYRDPAGKDPLVLVADRIQYPATEKGMDDKPVVKRTDSGEVEFLPSGAPNLYEFASRRWIRDLLDKTKISHAQADELLRPTGEAAKTETNPLRFLREIVAGDYFGNTLHRDGDMALYVRDDMEFNAGELNDIATALSAEATLPAQRAADKADTAKIKAGLELLRDAEHCSQCHHIRGEENKDIGVPDLQGYGSHEWLTEFIANPASARFYGEENDRMPAFAVNRTSDTGNKLTRQELDLLVRWLRGDYSTATH